MCIPLYRVKKNPYLSRRKKQLNDRSLGLDRMVLWDILVHIYCLASVRLWMFIVTFDSNSVIRWRLVRFINAVRQSSRRKLTTCWKTLTNYHVSQTARRKLTTCCKTLTNYHVSLTTHRKLTSCCKTLTNYHVSQTTRRKLPTYHILYDTKPQRYTNLINLKIKVSTHIKIY